MDNTTLIKKLNQLIQLDLDAKKAYEQALEKITLPEIHKQINQFKNDHQQHIDDLSRVVTSLGGTVPALTADFKGLLIQGFTALRSLTGTEGALKAMRGNEELTNATYKSALDNNNLPYTVRTLITKNYEDEKRHLNYIEQILVTAPWKKITS